MSDRGVANPGNDSDSDVEPTRAARRSKRLLSDEEEVEVDVGTDTVRSTTSGSSRKRRRVAKRNILLWSYFTETDDPSIVKCNVTAGCKAAVRRPDGSTSGMVSHFQIKHPAEYVAYLEKSGKDLQQRVKDDKAIAEAMTKHHHVVDVVRAEGGRVTPFKSRPITKGIEQYMNQRKMPTKYLPTADLQRRVDLDIMTFLATTNQPFSLVNEEGFKRY